MPLTEESEAHPVTDDPSPAPFTSHASPVLHTFSSDDVVAEDVSPEEPPSPLVDIVHSPGPMQGLSPQADSPLGPGHVAGSGGSGEPAPFPAPSLVPVPVPARAIARAVSHPPNFADDRF